MIVDCATSVLLSPSGAWLCEHPWSRELPTLLLQRSDCQRQVVICPACGAKWVVHRSTLGRKGLVATAVTMPADVPGQLGVRRGR